MVSLQRDGHHICGAGLISANWLLTSAKCVALGAQRLSVRAGSSDATNGTLFEVEKAILHPDYKSGSHNADIALLYVGEDLPMAPTPGSFKWVTLQCCPGRPAGRSIPKNS
nr:unnamed protein product [Callosobruchus analis]